MNRFGETVRNQFGNHKSEMLIRHSIIHFKKAGRGMRLESEERFELKIRI